MNHEVTTRPPNLLVSPLPYQNHTLPVTDTKTKTDRFPIMATRRILSKEKAVLEKDDKNDFSPPAGAKSDIAPAVPA